MKKFVVLSDIRREAVLNIACDLKVTGMFNELLSGPWAVREEVAKLISAEGIRVVNLSSFLKLEDRSAVWEKQGSHIVVYKTHNNVMAVRMS